MGPATLQDVLATQELASRSHRRRDVEAENRALIELSRSLPTSPDGFLQKACDVAMVLCRAQSTGVSLIEIDHGGPVFRWHAVSGRYASNVWGTMKTEFSPCGTVLDLGTTQLMKYPERHYTVLRNVGPQIVETLLAPLKVHGTAIGTIWLLSHEDSVTFAPSDAAALQTLAEFVGPVYEVLSHLISITREAGHAE
jgi:hypothetical protein